MMQWSIVLVSLCLVPATAAAGDTKVKQTSPAQRYKALVDEFDEVDGKYDGNLTLFGKGWLEDKTITSAKLSGRARSPLVS